MDQEFTELIDTVFNSDLRVEIIYEAIKIARDAHWDDSTITPTQILHWAILDWDK